MHPSRRPHVAVCAAGPSCTELGFAVWSPTVTPCSPSSDVDWFMSCRPRLPHRPQSSTSVPPRSASWLMTSSWTTSAASSTTAPAQCSLPSMQTRSGVCVCVCVCALLCAVIATLLCRFCLLINCSPASMCQRGQALHRQWYVGRSGGQVACGSTRTAAIYSESHSRVCLWSYCWSWPATSQGGACHGSQLVKPTLTAGAPS